MFAKLTERDIQNNSNQPHVPHLWYGKEKGAKLSVHMGTSDEYLEILHKLATAWAAENSAEYEGFG